MAMKLNNQGRCSATPAVVLITTIIVSLLLHMETTQAATFTVGDSSGWDFGIGNWASGKTFKAGDTLIFNYDPSVHNVVAVNKNGYNSCKSSATSTTFTSGRDQVTLSKGRHYFICSIPGHCDGGLKIAVNAS